MPLHLDPNDRAKLTAAYHAMDFIEDGMKVGLGTGSTAAWLVKLLGARRHLEGLEILAVSTSEATEALARKMKIPTTTLEEAGWLDLTIDGADEADADLTLIKGGGGALLREKIVATASDRMVVIADPAKMVETLGAFPLPVEVVKFGWEASQSLVRDILEDSDVEGSRILRRMRDGAPFVTDEGHFILDLHLGRIGDPEGLAADLLSVPGVVETGLFTDIAETMVVGLPSGEAVFHFVDDEPRRLDTADGGRLDDFLKFIG
ncbi:ribose-5-phosphate isomerase RpiA [Halovulum dunhuangense]|uniref:Ribose-5-phosphate isomerase A n=1 Tax=Halovulum dunhuangense TaxID=1505036 RepID=A0A849L1V8_9RHOB|nr:ribose-5-phosphate isomerase RpiA [Halovulum dunhuangense]NNU80253.1 ribose-5-phosphate isomerase RpiA [Halovulum dunhuangense]